MARPLAAGDGFDDVLRSDVREVRVRCSKRGMAELSLDDRDRDALHHEFERVRVAKTVRVDALRDARLESESLDLLADIRTGHRLAGTRAEEWLPRGEAAALAFDQPFLDHVESALIDADGPRPISLPMQDPNRAAEEVDVFGIESEGFAAPQACSIKDREKRSISELGVRLERACIEKGLDLLR
jgi:hypothetical protein